MLLSEETHFRFRNEHVQVDSVSRTLILRHDVFNLWTLLMTYDFWFWLHKKNYVDTSVRIIWKLFVSPEACMYTRGRILNLAGIRLQSFAVFIRIKLTQVLSFPRICACTWKLWNPFVQTTFSGRYELHSRVVVIIQH